MAYITNTKLSLENITSTNIPSTDALPIDLKKLKGNTTQDGTPTPTNPVPINVVTGEQEIKICGKNLFSLTNIVNNGTDRTTYTIENDNIVMTATSSGTYRYIYKTINNLTIGQEYTIKINYHNDTSTNKIAQWGVVNSGGNYYGYVKTLSSVQQLTFTPTETSATFRAGYLGNSCSENDVLTIGQIQLEKGNQATTYEPYIGKSYKINLGKNLYSGSDTLTSKYTYLLPIYIGETYTLSFKGLVTGSSTRVMLVNYGDIDRTTEINRVTVYLSSTINSYSIKLTANDNGYLFIALSGGANTYFFENIQLEKGSIATSYAPYKTPIELCEQDYIRKSTGKNLLEGLELGQINSNTGDETSSTTYVRSTNYIPYNTNDTYYPSINGSTNYSGLNGRFYNKDKEYIGYANISFSGMHNVTITKTTSVQDDTPKYFRFHTSLTNIGGVNANLMISTSTDKTYEPYGINWYIHKEIGKVVLDGSEDWRKSGTTSIDRFYITIPYIIASGVSGYSNRFIGIIFGTQIGTFQPGNVSGIRNGLFFDYSTYGTTTLADFKTWLSTHNTTVYYVLATPTYEIITDTELISQLEALSKAYTIRPTTNIIQTSNIPFYIDLDVYSGENPYQDTIYSQEDVNSCKLYFNNVELQDADNYLEKITFTKRVLPENGKKIFTLDNFIAEEVEIIIHDIDTSIIQDKVRIELGTLVNNTYEYVPMGVYNIQDIPTRNDNKITIKLRDNACLFDFNYNAKPLIDSLGGSATKMQILQDICNQANVNCNVNSFMGDSDFIGIYDNTITSRMYIAYIAEQAGCIAKIDRYGNLIFIPLNNLYTHRIPLNIVSKYVKGTPFKIERVVYELGTIKFETSNDETLQTLYISSANPYISVQNDIDRIFEIVENFELDSVEIQKEIIGNPAIDGYDLIEIYDDEDINKPVLFKTLANNTLIYNGKFKNKYKTEIGLEERTENVSKNSNETFKKTIKNEIDLVNGKITQTVEEISTLDDTINGLPTYVITTDTTFQADKPYYKLVDNDYVLLVEGTDYQDGDLISSVGYDVYDVIYVDSMMDTVNNNIQNQIQSAIQTVQSTILEQTSEKFTMWFEQTGVQDTLDFVNSLATSNSGDIETIRAYIDYGTVPQGEPYAGSPYILLGKDNSQTKLRILDNRIQFLSSGQETAYISNNTLYINESTILTKQVIGNNNGQWITDVDSQGNLNTYWGG